MKLSSGQSVYVIYNPELKITKVGVSCDIRARISTLRADSGCLLELKYNTTLISNAKYVENKVHEYFKDQHKIGEWFHANHEDIIRYLNELEEHFTDDIIIADMRRLNNVSAVARAHNVSRAAILKRLKRAGFKFYDDKPDFLGVLHVDIVDVEPKEQKKIKPKDVDGKKMVPIKVFDYKRINNNTLQDKDGKCFQFIIKDGVAYREI